MVAEDPVCARARVIIGQHDGSLVALHPDLMRSVDRAVDGGALSLEGGEENAMKAHGPLESFADDVEIALKHGSVLPVFVSDDGRTVPASVAVRPIDPDCR